MSSPEGDNRRHPRFSVDIEATVTLPEGDTVKARTRDLSQTGICLISEQALPGGAPVSIDLVLSFGNNAFSEPLRVDARVVWCTNIAGTYQVGAMFDELTDEQDGFLEMFLHFLDGTLAPKGVAGAEDERPEPEPEPESPEDKDDPFKG